MNAGSTTSGTALVTGTGGNFVQSTGVYTFSGATDLSAVTAGMFAAIYVDGDTAPTNNQYQVARITAVDDGADTITTSTSARSLMGTGTADGTGNRSIKVGGAWAGPTGAEGHPFDFVTSSLTNASAHSPRINVKVSGTYAITTGITINQTGPVTIQGYTSTEGDGGRFTLSSSSNITILTRSTSANWTFRDAIITSTNTTGTSAHNVNITSGLEDIWENVTVHGARACGILDNGVGSTFIECEVYDNVKGGAAGNAGHFAAASTRLIRCVARANNAADGDGHGFAGGGTCIHCISYGNGGQGFRYAGGSMAVYYGCDAYNNAGDGFLAAFSTAGTATYENCNAVKNGGYGINNTTTAGVMYVRKCGFGGGSDANTSGQTNFLAGTAVDARDSISYTSHPWSDPANGVFTITHSESKGQGRGTFVQASGGPTVGSPDVGAAQAAASSGGPMGTNFRGGFAN